MIVILEDDVFACGLAEPLALAALLRLGFEGRHRVRTDPPWAPELPLAVNRWLEAQSLDLREQAELALLSGLEDEVKTFSSDLKLRVAPTPAPDWGDPPRLPLEQALRILERPLRLMVEDEANDGAFLRTVAPAHWRGELVAALEKGWLGLEHGGGLPRMPPQLENRSKIEIMRLWVLFDSDAREPGKPSAESEAMRELCERRGIEYHQLRRRAAENYLPLPALAAWTHLGPRSRRKERTEKYLAFKEMSREQRHYYPMRGGFQKDEKAGIPELFSEFAQRPALRFGFGKSIRALFKQKHFRFHEEWLHKDGQQAETTAMTQAILRRL